MVGEQKQLLEQIQKFLESKEFSALNELIKKQRVSDIAEIVELLSNEQRRIIFDVLDKEIAAEVLEKVDQASRAELFEVLSTEELTVLVSLLDPDDAADIVSELPANKVDEVLEKIPVEKLAQIRRLMSYSEDSAGGIMDPVVISVPETATVAGAISKIRASEIDVDFYSVYVVDRFGRFLGNVRLRMLLMSAEDTEMHRLIEQDTIYVTADADQEEVRNIFSKNDLIVIPVLNKNHKLIGRITADRVIEVAEEEAAEDLYTMAGTDPDELDKVSSFRAARIRMTWLFPCLIGTAVTAVALTFFNGYFTSTNMLVIYTTAVVFVPMIAAISGNAGLQTSAIVVSGLATGHLAALRLRQVFTREVRIAILVALSCGIVGGAICAVFLGFKVANTSFESIRIILAFAIAMFSAIMVATTLGLFLPFLFKRVGIDPAISSGPLVTTANDSISVIIYMTLTLLLTL